MNKVLEVHGSLNYDDVDDSSDSDDENENNGISDAPMVFKNDSDDEELEVFESSKKNKGSLVKSNDKVLLFSHLYCISAHGLYLMLNVRIL